METIRKVYRVNRGEIAFLKFILEGYEGLAVLTTQDPQQGIIVLRIAPGCLADTELLLQNLRKSVMIEPVL
jgi:hypothetical protein